MSAQIIQFPRAKKHGVVPGEPVTGSVTDLMPRLPPVYEARDDLDERLHRFFLKRGIIKETDH